MRKTSGSGSSVADMYKMLNQSKSASTKSELSKSAHEQSSRTMSLVVDDYVKKIDVAEKKSRRASFVEDADTSLISDSGRFSNNSGGGSEKKKAKVFR